MVCACLSQGEGDGRAEALCLSFPAPSRFLAPVWGRGVQREPPGQQEALLCFHRPPTCAPLLGDLPLVRAVVASGAATSLSDTSRALVTRAAATETQSQTQPQPPGGRALRRAWH